MPSMPRALRWAACLLLVAACIFGMALTATEMAWLRQAVRPLSRGMSMLEHLDTPFDMDHVVFFTGIACTLRLLLPRIRWWWLALGVAILAAGTELMQFWVPGRTPKLLDVRDDLVGGAIGLLLGAAMMSAWRWWRRSD